MDRLRDAHLTTAGQGALMLALALSLAACGRSDPPPQPETTSEPAVVAAETPVETPVAVTPETPEIAPVAPADAPVPAPAAVAPPPSKPAAPPAQPAPVEKPAAFASCGGCHSVEEGGRNGIGPNLFGVMGRTVGSRAGYAYSDAMAADGRTWTPALMDEFLTGPRDAVPGTKMMAAPVRNAESRQALIAYLSSLK